MIIHPFNSLPQLNEKFREICTLSSVLQLGQGTARGEIILEQVGMVACMQISCSVPIAICGDRNMEKLCIGIELSHLKDCWRHTASGTELDRPALIGCNWRATELDIHLAAGTRMGVMMMPRNALRRWLKDRQLEDVLEILRTTDTAIGPTKVTQTLRHHLREIFRGRRLGTPHEDQLLLMELVDVLLEAPDKRKPQPRKLRYEAASKLLHLQAANPERSFDVIEVPQLVHSSRASLNNGCRELFGMSPAEVLRTVRLQHVQHLLVNPKLRADMNLTTISQVAAHYGFRSTGHFSRNYNALFKQMPSEDWVH